MTVVGGSRLFREPVHAVLMGMFSKKEGTHV